MSERSSKLGKYLEQHGFSPDEISRCVDIFKAKRDKIEEIAAPTRLVKYTFLPSGVETWVVIGEREVYVIFPPYYCSCSDFYFNAITRHLQPLCYHLIIQALGEMESIFTPLVKKDETYSEYMKELLDSA